MTNIDNFFNYAHKNDALIKSLTKDVLSNYCFSTFSTNARPASSTTRSR